MGRQARAWAEPRQRRSRRPRSWVAPKLILAGKRRKARSPVAARQPPGPAARCRAWTPRRPRRRPGTSPRPDPPRLRLSDQAAEVPRRPGITGGPRRRQQPLRRDPPRRLLHPGGDQLGHLVVVMAPILPLHRKLTGQPGPVRLHNPLHRLVGRAANLRSTRNVPTLS